ncbi:MAG: PilZ domain-containing protein [Gammaproteobacteria bacterium]|nr:PilZ domain-containing protein [Gammaproteobacteria bacterium]
MSAANIVEQRWSQRRDVALGVDVLENGEVIASCQSKDVGLGGVFIETDSPKLTRDCDYELCFSLGQKDAAKQKLKAKIVRAANNGYGFMFKDFDTNSFRALQEIMRHSSSVA